MGVDRMENLVYPGKVQMTQIHMTTFEVNDLLYSMEMSDTISEILDYIDAAIVGPTQPCCDYCESLLEAERNQ